MEFFESVGGNLRFLPQITRGNNPVITDLQVDANEPAVEVEDVGVTTTADHYSHGFPEMYVRVENLITLLKKERNLKKYQENTSNEAASPIEADSSKGGAFREDFHTPV